MRWYFNFDDGFSEVCYVDVAATYSTKEEAAKVAATMIAEQNELEPGERIQVTTELPYEFEVKAKTLTLEEV